MSINNLVFKFIYNICIHKSLNTKFSKFNSKITSYINLSLKQLFYKHDKNIKNNSNLNFIAFRYIFKKYLRKI